MMVKRAVTDCKITFQYKLSDWLSPINGIDIYILICIRYGYTYWRIVDSKWYQIFLSLNTPSECVHYIYTTNIYLTDFSYKCCITLLNLFFWPSLSGTSVPNCFLFEWWTLALLLFTMKFFFNFRIASSFHLGLSINLSKLQIKTVSPIYLKPFSRNVSDLTASSLCFLAVIWIGWVPLIMDSRIRNCWWPSHWASVQHCAHACCEHSIVIWNHKWKTLVSNEL